MRRWIMVVAGILLGCSLKLWGLEIGDIVFYDAFESGDISAGLGSTIIAGDHDWSDAQMKSTAKLYIAPYTLYASLAVVFLLGWVAFAWAEPPQKGIPVIRLEGCTGSDNIPQIHWRPAARIREVKQDEIPSWLFSGCRLARLPVSQPGDAGYEIWAAVHKVADPDPDEGLFASAMFEAALAIHTLELDIDADPGAAPTSEHWYTMPLSFPVDESDEDAVEGEEKVEPGTFFALEVLPPVLTTVSPDSWFLVKVSLTTEDSAMRATFWSKRSLVLQIRRASPEVLLVATGCSWAEGGRCWDWRVDHRSLMCSARSLGACRWNLLCSRTVTPYDESRRASAISMFEIGDDLSIPSNLQTHREPRLELPRPTQFLLRGTGNAPRERQGCDTQETGRHRPGGRTTPGGPWAPAGSCSGSGCTPVAASSSSGPARGS